MSSKSTVSPLSLADIESLQFNDNFKDYHEFSSARSISLISTPNRSLYTSIPIQTPAKMKKPNNIPKNKKCKTKIIVGILIFGLMILISIGSLLISTQVEPKMTTTTKTTTTTLQNSITMTAYDFTSTPNPFTCEQKWIGDGICDDVTNLLKCAFDYGDCCLNEIVDTYCYECICHIDKKRHQMTTTTQMPELQIPEIQYKSIVPPLAVSKLLILTGQNHSQNERGNETMKIEVLDLQNPLKSCSLLEEFPKRLTSAVGGFTKDGPLLCGGFNSDTYSMSKDCFIMNNTKFFQISVSLQTEREKASAIVLPNGTLWIQGGSNEGSKKAPVRLKSSETMSLQESEYGMELEEPNKNHCSVLINSTTAFVTGGYDGPGTSSSVTYFVDINNSKSSKGPYMKEARRQHGCALFRHNNHNYVIVAGGISLQTKTSSTEILNLDSQLLEWTKGPELQAKMKAFALVSTSQGLISVGGWDDTNKRNKDEILKLKCQDGEDISTCKWEEYSQKLEVARNSHVVIPLPASYEICNH